MVTYWCVWCGATAERETDEEWVSCTRCLREFARLLGYVPRAPMTPLERGEEPGEPAAARKRFEFRDARTGAVRGWTAAVGAVLPDAAGGER